MPPGPSAPPAAPGASGPPGIDPAQWARLSPRLDTLLDLPADARAARLAALRAEDAGLAGDLERLLQQMAALESTAFMRAPAQPPGGGEAGGAADPAPEAGSAGMRVGAYTLERELGRGGMGSVWLAHRTDGRYEGQVAIKFLQAALFGHAAGDRFGREGRILGRLDHPHIARLLDAGHLGGEGPGAVQPYLVLEYVDGEPIDRWCERRALPLEARVRLFLDVLAAVGHAHNRLILHRDLKPSNILVTQAGQVKLLDFGIAKLLDDADAPAAAGELTRRAGPAFTPAYAAPEQRSGGEVSTATDVYALGVLLYRLLAGRLPTEGTTLVGPEAESTAALPRLSAAARRSPDPAVRRMAAALRGDLDTVAAKALKPEPAERYANAAAFAADLQRWLAHEPVQARPDRWTYRSARFLRRHRVGVGAGALVVLALAGGGLAAWREAREAQAQRAQAEGLIEFMLGDLPARLKPVGRLDALDAVGERALAYYAAQDPGALDAAALGRRSRALHLLGEIEEQRGRLDAAARRFAEAEAATGALLARHPDDPQHIFEHAQSAYWVGFIARRRGQAAAAEAAFERYHALAQDLVRREPGHADWQTELAYAGVNLGVLRLESGQAAAALRDFGGALALWDRLAAAQPPLQLERANALGWIAEAQAAVQDYAAAIDAQRRKLEALARVPDAARDREVAYLVANTHVSLAALQLALGDAAAALAAADEGERQFVALTALDEDNQLWLSQLAAARLSQGEALLALGRAEAARAAAAAAGSVMRRLLAVPEPNTHTRVSLQGRWLRLQALAAAGAGSAQALAGNGQALAGSEQALADYLAMLDAHEADQQALDAGQAQVAAAAGLTAGDLARRRGDESRAQALWAAAARRLQAGVQRGQAPAVALQGLLALRREEITAAQASLAMLRASAYRHPDRQALQAGLEGRLGRGD